ncbi:hypothetical protein BO70DRAFT_371099 [Aspergillus heteromorphus CBS 117.55]|uniref:Zn(2)-C6 fungal-type domain-containing protein n=1 Tax=Aspergillus heteromorphus CBS 117.55 TaxID=1448321 RepID=A0A317W681_9EURO|nr:uncharacterized protein BO70DRAFT_371099 [Aspergillus heteromorphus CBS 117.55]PWY82114.1 hypothetical protein BO70DRAFT_371099 [Aspergillus heteromorphus CBS 117.55]
MPDGPEPFIRSSQPHHEPNEGVVANAGVSASPRKRKRVKTGCLTCRARKVKCDEARPACNHCRNLTVECRWADGSPGQWFVTPSTIITSKSPACLTCRYARSKCSKARPSCARCLLYRHECQYPKPTEGRALTSSAEAWMKRLRTGNSQREDDREVTNHDIPSSLGRAGLAPQERPTVESAADTTGVAIQHNHTPTQETGSTPRTSRMSNNNLPSPDRIQRLAVAFFQHVHVYRANAFLHRDRTLAAIRERTLSETIIFALCAIGSRFTSPPEPEEVAKEWAAQAGHLVTTAMEASRETITTSLLLTIYTQQAGRFTQSHLWSTIAISQAVALGLHHESPPGTRSFVHSERDRRLFFACYASNRLIANGTPESIQCPASRIKLRLPCDGFNFQMELNVETPESALETDDSHVPAWMYRNVGVMGFWVRLVGVRVMIRRYFHNLRETISTISGERCNTNIPAPWSPNSPFQACMAKLAWLRESLPVRLQLTRDRVTRRHGEPALGQVVMFYLWWNECHVELCSVALSGYPQSLGENFLSTAPAGWVEQTRQGALRHAQAIADILALVARETPGEPLVIYDHTIAHVVYLSIRVQLELDTADDVDGAKLKDRVDTMLAFVERTSVYFHPVYLVKSLDASRLAEKVALVSSSISNDEASLNAILLELLPDCTAYGATSSIRGYESSCEGVLANYQLAPPATFDFPMGPNSGRMDRCAHEYSYC